MSHTKTDYVSALARAGRYQEGLEPLAWRCRLCRRPSYLMFDTTPREDGICRGCTARIREGIPIQKCGNLGD